jgi:hypothetical protein
VQFPLFDAAVVVDAVAVGELLAQQFPVVGVVLVADAVVDAARLQSVD